MFSNVVGSTSRPFRHLVHWFLLPTIVATSCSAPKDAAVHISGRSAGTLVDSAEVVIRDSNTVLGIVSAGQLFDSSFVISDQANLKIHRFSRTDGRLQRTWGSKGKGPGEFESIRAVQRIGTRLWVFDIELRRTTTFGIDDGAINVTSFEPSPGAAYSEPIGLLDSATLVVRTTVPVQRERIEALLRDTVLLLRASLAGKTRDTIAKFLGGESFVRPFGRAGELRTMLPFGQVGESSVADDRIFILDQDKIRIVTSKGTIQVAMARDSMPQKIELSDVRLAKERFTNGAPPSMKLEAVFDAMPLPTAFPRFGWFGEKIQPSIRATTNGDVWIHNARRPSDAQTEWIVVASDGTVRGTISTRRPTQLLDSDGRFALTLEYDDDDAPLVKLRRINW